MQQQPLKQKTKSNNFVYQRDRFRKSPEVSDNGQSSQLRHYRNIGNQAVQRMLESRSFQAKLKIGKPNDKYEQEADSVADRVMKMEEESLVNGHWSLGRKEGEESLVSSHLSLVRKKDESAQTKPLVEQITPLVQRQPEEDEEVQSKSLVQKQEEEEEEEEPVQTKLIQRQELPEEEEEEEPVQTKLVQRQEEEEEEEEPVQTKLIQRQELPEEEEEEEEPVQTKLIQRQEEEPEEEEEETPVLTKAAPGSTPKVTPNIESSISSMKGGGQPLSESTRSFFEPRFGADFSKVRVHTDSRAAETAQAINARAFTTGKDIAFNTGQYSPNTTPGKRLLAHELTHVVQQKPGKGLRIQMSKSAKQKKKQKIAQSESEILKTKRFKAYWNPKYIWQKKFRMTKRECILATKHIYQEEAEEGRKVKWRQEAYNFFERARDEIRKTGDKPSIENGGFNNLSKAAPRTGLFKYGIYCGEDRTCTDFSCRPIDEIDDCCQEHDSLYGPYGFGDLEGKGGEITARADRIMVVCLSKLNDFYGASKIFQMLAIKLFGKRIELVEMKQVFENFNVRNKLIGVIMKGKRGFEKFLKKTWQNTKKKLDLDKVIEEKETDWANKVQNAKKHLNTFLGFIKKIKNAIKKKRGQAKKLGKKK